MIAWIDLETTGLDTECSIIEVACVMTDVLFNRVATTETLVHPEPWGNIEDYAQQMHVKSGLWEKALACDKTIKEVDRTLSEFIKAVAGEGQTPILGGQSVHFDRAFIDRWMPETSSRLSHRQIDVSGLKLMWSYALGIPTESLPPEKSKTIHRAMDDILASIEAARWYSNYISSGGSNVNR